jgi:hypothetical protein
LGFYHPKNQEKTKPTAGETQSWVLVADRRLVARWVAARWTGLRATARARDGDGEVMLRDPRPKKKKKKEPTARSSTRWRRGRDQREKGSKGLRESGRARRWGEEKRERERERAK